MAALERAKVRRADVVVVVHPASGPVVDGRCSELVGYAEQLGKRIRHYGVDEEAVGL